MTTKTTIGQLVANLFAKHERRYHDARFAAIVTQGALANLQRSPRPQHNVGLCEASAAASRARAEAWESLQTDAWNTAAQRSQSGAEEIAS